MTFVMSCGAERANYIHEYFEEKHTYLVRNCKLSSIEALGMMSIIARGQTNSNPYKVGLCTPLLLYSGCLFVG